MLFYVVLNLVVVIVVDLCSFFLPQTADRGAPAPLSGGGDGLAAVALPDAPPPRRAGLAGTRAVAAELRHGQRERRRQRQRDPVGARRAARPAAARPADGGSDGGEMHTGGHLSVVIDGRKYTHNTHRCNACCCCCC